MPVNLKPLIVVVGIAWLIFLIAKPLFLSMMSAEDYSRRRNVWFVLTLSGFLLPSFWLYVAVAVVVIAWAAKRDSNPAALYMLVLYALPPTEFQIPQFIAVNQFRILSIVILIPIAFRALTQANESKQYNLTLLDAFVLLFGLWQLVLFMPYEAITNTFRRFSVYFLDTFIIFFAIARAGRTKREVTEIVAMFVLAACVLAVIGGFEYARSWLLYQFISESWGQQNLGAYLMRDGKLRAQVSTGHALALGYVMMFAFGLSLYVRRYFENARARFLLPLVMWVGLIAAYSRGPWFAAILVFFGYAAMQPQGLRKVAKALGVAVIIGGVFLMTPLGDNVVAALPFVGTVDQENVTYRQQLAEVSWRLILQNPWMGDPFFMDNMEELRQGEGIIDLMNGYAAVSLYSGVIGLALYMGVFLIGAWRTFWSARTLSRQGDDFAHLGFALVACMLGTLLTIGVSGTGSIYYVLAGMMAAYARVCAYDVSAQVDSHVAPPNPWQFTGTARGLRSHPPMN